MTFTKEQLIKRIDKQIDINATIIERLGDDSAAASELAVETATMDIKILDIARTALTTSERAELENYRNAQQVVPDGITQENAPEIHEIAAEVERLGLRGTYGSYAVGWNACRAAMQSGSVKDGWLAVSGCRRQWSAYWLLENGSIMSLHSGMVMAGVISTMSHL